MLLYPVSASTQEKIASTFFVSTSNFLQVRPSTVIELLDKKMNPLVTSELMMLSVVCFRGGRKHNTYLRLFVIFITLRDTHQMSCSWNLTTKSILRVTMCMYVCVCLFIYLHSIYHNHYNDGMYLNAIMRLAENIHKLHYVWKYTSE